MPKSAARSNRWQMRLEYAATRRGSTKGHVLLTWHNEVTCNTLEGAEIRPAGKRDV